jgi:GT2 family glycosyltransferase
MNLPKNNGKLAKSIQEIGAKTPSSSFLFKKEVLKKVDGFDEDLISGIDHDIWMKLAVAGYSNLIVPKPLVVIYEDQIETMMTNTKKRIAGIRQYVKKWTPTYKEWYGEKAGAIYAKRYFIRVIGGLAGQKLAGSQYKEGCIAAREIVFYAGVNLYLNLFALQTIVKRYLKFRFPILSRIKDKISNNQ